MCGESTGHVNFDLDSELQGQMGLFRYQWLVPPKLSQIDTENVLTVNRNHEWGVHWSCEL